MKISVVQTHPILLNVERNLSALARLIKPVASDLFILPELCTSGYAFRTRAEVKKCAEKIPSGPTCSLLRQWAKEKKCAIVAGLPEISNGVFYNSAVMVTPTAVHLYRKMHVFFNEKRFFKAGNTGFNVFSWKNRKIGMMICFDWIFPEAARTLSVKGADMIAHPSNLVLPYAPNGMKIRSLENHVYTVTANRIGAERGLKFNGGSQIIGLKGETLVSMGKKSVGVKSVSIDLSLARNKWFTPKNHLFNDRRRAWYK